ncbi:MAG TPA: retropepsin-like aspartic protease [Candidatus Nanoarchaeia archaeon]|nr:retropepsin-like aspartic protease [Candidatus Nanoarchaeia archaeon]
MPSVTIGSQDLIQDGPILEVHFLISSELEKKYNEDKIPFPAPVVVKALIDTGATTCVIQKSIPETLRLQPVGKIKIQTPSSKDHECFQYFMRMHIPIQGITYEGVFIATPLEGQNIGCLIGRDLLQKGILIYIGYMNQFTFSLL